METSDDFTQLLVEISKTGQLIYRITDEDGENIGGNNWPNADRTLRDIRAEFPDEFRALGGTERVNTFLRALTHENAPPTRPARLYVDRSSIDLSSPEENKPIVALDNEGRVIIHDFQF